MCKSLTWANRLIVSTLLLALTAVPALAAEAANGEKPNLLPAPGGPQIATAIITLVIFSALLAVLGKFAWGPISKGLEEREGKIRADIEAAERARADAEKAQADYKAQIAGAENRVRDLIAQAQADGQQLATRIKMQAQEDAEEIKERANREIEQSRREAVEQIRAEAGTLAVAVAEKILRREVTVDDQQRLIEASLEEMQRSGVNGDAVAL